MSGQAGRRYGRRGLLALAGGAGVTLLTACGRGGDRQPRRAVTPTPAPAVDLPPRPGGVLRVRGMNTPALDPHTSASAATQRLAAAVYSRLLRFRAGPDPAISADYLVEPDLAAAWELVPDGLQLIFHLQPAARWHDIPPVSGRAVEAGDVAYSLERFRGQKKNVNHSAFGSDTMPLVERIETPDQRTVVIHLARPYGPILSLFASPQHLWVLPREADSEFDPARTAIGSGPFLLESVEAEIRTRVRRNPHYFVPGRPYIDAYERWLFKEEQQERDAFQAERLDLAAVVAEAKPEIERSNPRARWLTYVPPTYTFLAPQLRGSSPYRDVRVRRALSLALDRKGWLDLMYPGTRGRYLNLVPASMGRWWLDPQGPEMGDEARWFRHEPKEARALLRAAGVEGLTMRFIYPHNAYGGRFKQGVEATIGMLRDAGFTVQAVAQDYVREFFAPNGTITGNYDGVFYALQTAFTDPHDYLFAMHHTASRRNHAGVQDPQADWLIDLTGRTLDEGERVARVKEAQRYLAGRLYYIPLAVGETYTALQPWVQGYRHALTAGIVTESYAELWLAR